MRISKLCIVVCVTALGASAATALDSNLAPADRFDSGYEAYRAGYEAYKAGDADTALKALNFAAESGIPGALWKLGRMYQTGDLVAEDDRKAMLLFQRIASDYGDGNPRGPDAPFVADALVTLGGYYRSGIPGSVKADPNYAKRIFGHAALIYGNAEAQYALGVMLLQGPNGPQDAGAAARWLRLAANKGHVGAQAELGHILYEGIGVARQPNEGLSWLTIARQASPGDPVIQAMHEQAFSTADETLRRAAVASADKWMKKRTGGQQAQAVAVSPAQ